jgi:hypothetical protein
MKLEALQRRLLRECDKAGGILAWARKHGIPQPSVHHAAMGHRAPTEKICAALGYKRELRFTKIKNEQPA